MILGIGCNTVINTKQGELSLDTVKDIRNIENSLEQIGKIVKSRDDRIKGLHVEIRELKNERYKTGENFALKTQELKDCREREILGILQKYTTDQFEKKIKQQRKYINAQGKENRQLEDSMRNLKQWLEAVQIYNIAN